LSSGRVSLGKPERVKVNFTKARSGDLIVVVQFDPQAENFNAQNLTWCPRVSELREIMKAMALASYLNAKNEDELNAEL
jgi:hypothetical protein